jgi:hypothetical protein
VAGNIELKYGTSGQTITCTLASLGNGSARGAAAVDNSTNVFEDAMVQLTLKSGASGTTATGIVNIYATGTSDGGTTYGEGAGSDAAVTLTAPPNAKLIGTINVVANATIYKSTLFSVAAAFGGFLPQKWALIIENKTGGSLDATAGSFTLQYIGVLHQYT